MAEILLVSKPVAPPWNDSGKNLVRDLARGLSRHRPTIMVSDARTPLPAGARSARVYGGAGSFAPRALDQARVLAYLLCVARGHDIWHFFFAPNARSCRAGRLATRLRRPRSLHTISSAPRDPRAIVPALFADLNVVLSAHTEQRLLEAGLSNDRLRRIAPAIEPLTPKPSAERPALRRSLGLPESAALVVYPGDLEFGGGAHLMVEVARALGPDTWVVLACRVKTPRARAAEAALRARARSLEGKAHVVFAGETPRIHDLLACADLVALPAADLYAKMDYPLVLLEAMSLGRSVVVAEGSAAEELCADDAALALPARAEPLAEGIGRLLADDAARARYGEAARASVLARFSYPTMAHAYERLYDALVG